MCINNKAKVCSNNGSFHVTCTLPLPQALWGQTSNFKEETVGMT